MGKSEGIAGGGAGGGWRTRSDRGISGEAESTLCGNTKTRRNERRNISVPSSVRDAPTSYIFTKEEVLARRGGDAEGFERRGDELRTTNARRWAKRGVPREDAAKGGLRGSVSHDGWPISRRFFGPVCTNANFLSGASGTDSPASCDRGGELACQCGVVWSLVSPGGAR